jgi:hypothetical protein
MALAAEPFTSHIPHGRRNITRRRERGAPKAFDEREVGKPDGR